MVNELEIGRFTWAFDSQPFFGGGGRFDYRRGRRQRPGRDGLVKLPDPGKHFLSIEVAGKRQHSIIRAVIGVVVMVKVIPLHGFQVAEGANHLMAVRVDRKSCLLDGLSQAEEGLVFTAFPLRDDHGTLRCNFLGVVDGVDHAVGFQAQAEVDLFGGKGLEEGGPIQVSHGVPNAPFVGDGFVEHAGWKLRGAFELHVLHPMGDAGVPGGLVPSPPGTTTSG